MNIEAVILDFDGTLLDSYNVGLRHMQTIVERHGLVLTAERQAQVHDLWGCSGVELLERVFALEPPRAQHLYREWEQLDMDDPIPLVCGARETLQWLRTRRCVACVLTSRHRGTVVPILARERLDGYFARVTAREDSAFCKPDRRAFTGILQILARQKVSRAECLFVGDTFVDIEAGRNAELRTVVVETGPYRRGHGTVQPLAESHVIRSIADLPAWMQSQ